MAEVAKDRDDTQHQDETKPAIQFPANVSRPFWWGKLLIKDSFIRPVNRRCFTLTCLPH